MHRGNIAIAAAVLGLGACTPASDDKEVTAAPGNAQVPIAPAPSPIVPAPAPVAPPAPGMPGGLPDDRTPLNEPRGPIDPKSAEAAGQVVQLYGALIEERKFGEAEKQWGDVAAARQFSAALRQFSEVHLQIGKPGDGEGAAGSIFVTVPVLFYGRGGGGPFNRKGDVTLRRVNDVDGSTEAQRRWHIERIDWAKP